jgi:hypothetical protein
MSDSRCFFPFAEEDGPDRYLLMEFMGARIHRYPTLLRGVIFYDPVQSRISVRGFLTWTHTLIVIWLLVFPLAVGLASGIPGALCGSVPFAAYFVGAVILYGKQAARFRRLAERWAAYLSGDDLEAASTA